MNPGRADALAEWLATHADHYLVDRGRVALLDAYLQIARQGPRATPESELQPADRKALALAAGLYRQDLPVGRADAWPTPLQFTRGQR